VDRERNLRLRGVQTEACRSKVKEKRDRRKRGSSRVAKKKGNAGLLGLEIERGINFALDKGEEGIKGSESDR